MAKLTLTDPSTNFQSTTQISANNTLIEAAIENTLSRDGTTPNQMQASLDMNGYAIINEATGLDLATGVPNVILVSTAANFKTYMESSSVKTVLVASAITLTSSVTGHANSNLMFLGQGSIDGAYTLTINGDLNAEEKQIFGSTITVAMTSKATTRMVHFGFADDALTDVVDRKTAVDAVLACGAGTIIWDKKINASHVRQQDETHVIFMYDGRLQMPSGFDATLDNGFHPVSGVTWAKVTNFRCHGNATRAAQYDATNNWSAGFAAYPPFDKGAFRSHGLFVSPGRTEKDTWVSPDVYIVEGYSYVEETVRNCFIFQMDSNRVDDRPGNIVVNGTLHGKNAHIDHIFYSDQQQEGFVNHIICEGHAHVGYVVESGLRINTIEVINPIANPDSNTNATFKFGNHYVVDNRDDAAGSNIGSITYTGDLATLDDSTTEFTGPDLDGTSAHVHRTIVRFVGSGAHIDNIAVNHTGADFSTHFAVLYGLGGRGVKVDNVYGNNMPSGSQIIYNDPKEAGEDMKSWDIGIGFFRFIALAAAVDQPLVFLGGTAGTIVNNVKVHGGTVFVAGVGGEGGAKYMIGATSTDCTIQNAGWKDVAISSVDNASEAISLPADEAAVLVTGLFLENVNVNNKPPSGFTGSVTNIKNSTFVDSHSGPSGIQSMTALYDFDLHGGAQGEILLGKFIPLNGIVTKAWYEVVDAVTSGGAATVAIGVDGQDTDGILAAAAYDGGAFSIASHDSDCAGTAAGFTVKTTGMRDIILTVATADLTGGKIYIHCEYVVSES